MNININKHLFAAYCGMLKSGYDLMDLSDPVVAEIHAWVSLTNFGTEIPNYFLFTKTNTVSVNPYYPRGSDLSAACFFQCREIDKYVDFLQMCNSPEANNTLFIEWISNLPRILHTIENHDNFNEAYTNYRECLLSRFIHVSAQITEIEKSLKSPPFNTPASLIFAPNLLQSKFLADYVLVDDMFYVIASTFQRSAVIHEYLHLALKPFRSLFDEIVQKHSLDRYFDVDRIGELGYLRGNAPSGKAHVLEECFTRALCGVLDTSIDLSDYCRSTVQSGFHSVPKLIDKLSYFLSSGMSLYEIIIQTENSI